MTSRRPNGSQQRVAIHQSFVTHKSRKNWANHNKGGISSSKRIHAVRDNACCRLISSVAVRTTVSIKGLAERIAANPTYDMTACSRCQRYTAIVWMTSRPILTMIIIIWNRKTRSWTSLSRWGGRCVCCCCCCDVNLEEAWFSFEIGVSGNDGMLGFSALNARTVKLPFGDANLPQLWKRPLMYFPIRYVASANAWFS